VIGVRGGKLGQSISITLLTSLENNSPVYFTVREKSNSQADFLEFLCNAIDAGFLEDGDYLILDNSSVHTGNEYFDALIYLLDSIGISLIYLPKYSPEFNPCELVFAQIKNRLRNYRKNEDLYWELCIALAHVSIDNVISYYYRCCHEIIVGNK